MDILLPVSHLEVVELSFSPMRRVALECRDNQTCILSGAAAG